MAVEKAKTRLRKATPNRGFTIVELLVVIAVITVLVSMILPVVTKIRISSQSLACISNLRHMGVAEQAYAMNFGYVLPHVNEQGHEWHQNYYFRRAMGLAEQDVQKPSNTAVWSASQLCPASGVTARNYRKVSLASAYGMNHENTRRPEYEPYRSRWYRYLAVKKPATKLLLMDAPTWECTMNQENDYVAEGTYNSSGSIAGANAYRHGLQGDRNKQLITVLFFDFHVEQRTRAQITGSSGQWMYWQ